MDNVILLSGAEEYLIKEYVDKAKERIQNLDFNFNVFEDVNEEEIINACLQTPFLEDYKAVVVNGDLFKKDYKQLQQYCENPIISTVLILITSNVDKRKKLYQVLNRNGKVIIFNKLKGTDYLNFIKNYFDKRNVQISNDLISIIADRFRYLDIEEITLRDITMDLDKLISYFGGVVTTKAVMDIIKPPIDNNVFRFIELVNRKEHAALTVLDNLLNNGTSVMQLLALLARHYRIMYKLKVAGNAELGLSSFQLKGFSNSSNATVESIIESIKLVNATQTLIRSGSIDMRLGIEVLTVNLLH
ncbi:MAG: DNA polymerase III subunit delta [Clostridia bacterium]